ncbi:MAG: DUF1127 domain-containing protein [Pseudomonadota bacterium]
MAFTSSSLDVSLSTGQFTLERLLTPFRFVWQAVSNRRAIQNIAELDDHMLADIGLKREEVMRAQRLPLWVDPVDSLNHAACTRRNAELWARNFRIQR